MTKSVLLPQTYLARDLAGNLARCFDEVYLLRPVVLAQGETHALKAHPEEYEILAASQIGEDNGFDPSELKGLIHQWEDWIAGQRGSGNLDTLKAGVSPPPPDQETSSAIMNQVKSGRLLEERRDKPPSAPPGLVLQLAHLLEKQGAEMRSLAAGVGAQQEHMSELLGQGMEGDPPAEFQKIDPLPLRPMGLEMEDESLTSYRLQAWASLAPFARIKDLTPMTTSPEAALLLLERANLVLGGKPVRSAAGAQRLLWPPESPSMVGAVLAREALRLKLPLPQEATGFKEALGRMLKALGEAPLSADLLKSLQAIGASWLESGDSQPSAGCLSLVVFPGYGLAGLLNLMKGQLAEPEAPGASCPLWVLW